MQFWLYAVVQRLQAAVIHQRIHLKKILLLKQGMKKKDEKDSDNDSNDVIEDDNKEESDKADEYEKEDEDDTDKQEVETTVKKTESSFTPQFADESELKTFQSGTGQQTLHR